MPLRKLGRITVHQVDCFLLGRIWVAKGGNVSRGCGVALLIVRRSSYGQDLDSYSVVHDCITGH